jgi:hypothetical protein
VERKDDGSVTLYLSYGDENAQYLNNDLKAGALPAFFGNRTFNIEWLQTCTEQVYVGFYPKDSPQNYSFGMLEN